MQKKLPFWLAYTRALLIFFVIGMAINWLAYIVTGSWLDWYGVLALAAVLPGIGLMITWDEI